MAVLDTVIICDEFYYKRLINTYSITIVIQYSLNILMIIYGYILIAERKCFYCEKVVFK